MFDALFFFFCIVAPDKSKQNIHFQLFIICNLIKLCLFYTLTLMKCMLGSICKSKKTDLLAQFNLYLRYKAVEASSLSLMSSGASSDQKNFQRLLTIYAFYA